MGQKNISVVKNRLRMERKQLQQQQNPNTIIHHCVNRKLATEQRTQSRRRFQSTETVLTPWQPTVQKNDTFTRKETEAAAPVSAQKKHKTVKPTLASLHNRARAQQTRFR